MSHKRLLKRSIPAFLAIFIALYPRFCLSGQYDNPSRKTSRVALDTIQVYDNDDLGRPYIIIGRVVTNHYDMNGLIKRVKKIALKNGGDAVINFRVPQANSQKTTTVMPIYGGGAMGVPTTSSIFMGEGFVVKWPGTGESGVTRIDGKLTYPILNE